MNSRQTRFATACQQLLALAAVVALLLPAANVVSLDVIGDSPLAAPSAPHGAAGTADTVLAADQGALSTQIEAEAAKVSDHEPATDPTQKAAVNTAPVDAEVTEYDLEAPVTGAGQGAPKQVAPKQSVTQQSEESAAPDAGLQAEDVPSADASTAPTAPATSATPSDEQTAHPAAQAPAEAVTETLADGRTQLTAAPQDVTSFGMVGVTWNSDEQVPEGELTLQVRANDAGTWSNWSDLEYHDDHAPDADSDEAAAIRPGTEPVVIGQVDQVQVRAISAAALPTGLRLAVVEAEQGPTALQAPAIDTATLPETQDAATEGAQDGLDLQAGAINKAKQPVIYSRAQWGANESLRDKSSLRYGTVNGGFVHHTVSKNDYTKEQVPAILQGIYAYHTRSRGWSDIGYNYLIDRFGRIWEGRYGGVTKAPVGAHTLGYNEYSFAASAIGNYDITKPSEATVNAYAALFAWKLGVYGVSASSTKQKIGRTWFRAINGHRDAGSTACPGKYLYARLGDIRTRAAALQAGGGNNGGGSNNGGSNGGTGGNGGGSVGGNGTNLGNGAWTGASIRSNLTNRAYPDLVVVRNSDKRAMVLPTGGLSNFNAPRTISQGWGSTRSVQISKDLTGDGKADILFLTSANVLGVRPGKGNGKFAASKRAFPNFTLYRSPRAAGDLNGDGRGDMIAWIKRTGRVQVFLGTGQGTFVKGPRLSAKVTSYTTAYPAGDLTGDGKVDLLGIKAGRLYLHPGQGNGRFTPARPVAGSWSQYKDLAGGADLTGDGKADLVARDRAGRLSVFPGKGNGTFGAPYGPTQRSISALNGISTVGNLVDGAGADLVGRQGDALVVVPNADTYEIGAPIDTGRTLPSANALINAGDWDRDGKGDIITRSSTTGALYVWRGIGGGKLASGSQIATGFTRFSNITVIGDVTGDGYPDLVATGPTGKSFVYPGNGLKGIKARLAAPLGAVMKLPVSTVAYDWVVPVSNLTKSSTKADVVVREKATGRLYVLEAASGYTTRRLLSESVAGYSVL